MQKVNGIVPLASAGVLTLLLSPPGTPAKNTKENAPQGPAVLWRDPADIRARNLIFGPGGKAHEPKAPFKFDKEDTSGTNPKFDVVDAAGVEWTVKLGEEAGPETAASRLVWAVGYFANENYFLPVLKVENMKHLSRGSHYVARDGTVKNVRLKRHGKEQEKIGTWQWGDNPFKDTREWYGLQVMMALVNNWDLKDVNNSIYQVRGDHPEQRYVVSDLGRSFGPTHIGAGAKNNPKAYLRSKWISKPSSGTVDFKVPAGPAWYILFNPGEVRRLGMTWIGRDVPAANARWIGQLLSQLSPDQLRDAFRTAGYPPDQVEALSAELQRRIATLAAL